MSAKTYALLLVLLIAVLSILVLHPELNAKDYEIVTSDGVVVYISGACEREGDSVICGAVRFEDVQEFREIK